MEGVTEVPFKFEYDSTSGKYGYRDGADTFRPFNDGGGDDRVLLWTNPNPTSAFAAQWVAVDVTSYDYIIIKVLSTTNASLNPYTKEYIVELNTKSSSNNTDGIFIGTAYMPDNNGNGSFRYVRIDPTYGIYFWAGISTYQYQSANTIAIPLEIYGCNKVVPSGATSITIPQYIANIGKSSGNVSTANSYTALSFSNMNSYTNISIESISSDSSCTVAIYGDGQYLYNNSGQVFSNISVNFSNISNIQISITCPSIGASTAWSMNIALLRNIVIS